MHCKYPLPNKLYLHYGGGLYKCICISIHTETQEELVTYTDVCKGTNYTRPLSLWNEAIEGPSSERYKHITYEDLV